MGVIVTLNPTISVKLSLVALAWESVLDALTALIKTPGAVNDPTSAPLNTFPLGMLTVPAL